LAGRGPLLPTSVRRSGDLPEGVRQNL